MLKGRRAQIIPIWLLLTVLLMVFGGDSARGQRVYADDENHSSGLLSSISHPEYAIDLPNITNSASLDVTLGLFGLVGDASESIYFNHVTKPSIGSPITIRFSSSKSLLTLSAGIAIRKINSGVEVGPTHSGTELLSLLTVLGTDKEAEATLNETNINYDGIKFTVGGSGVSAALNGKLYYAFFITSPAIESRTICSGSAATFNVTNTPTSGFTYTYNWYDGSGNLIPGVSGPTYTTPVLTTGVTNYSVEAVEHDSSNGKLYYSAKVPITATVNSVTGGAVGSSQTICSNFIPAAFISVTNGTASGTLTYQWQNSTDNNTFNNISGATSATYTESTSLTQTTYYRRIATSTLNSVGCTAISNVITVTVNTLNPGTVGSNQSICYNFIPLPFTDISPAISPGTITYKWQISTNNIAFTDIPSATNATYTETAALIQTTYYRRVASSILNTQVCNSTSNTITVIVNPLPTISLGSIVDVCQGITSGSLPYSTTTGSPTTYKIVWKTAASTAGFIDVSYTTLTSSPITFPVPINPAVAIYTGSVIVKNVNTCESIAVDFNITIHPKLPQPHINITANQ